MSKATRQKKSKGTSILRRLDGVWDEAVGRFGRSFLNDFAAMVRANRGQGNLVLARCPEDRREKVAELLRFVGSEN